MDVILDLMQAGKALEQGSAVADDWVVSDGCRPIRTAAPSACLLRLSRPFTRPPLLPRVRGRVEFQGKNMYHVIRQGFCCLLFASVVASIGNCGQPVAQSERDCSAYLFAYFIGNGPGEEQIRFALSDDGYHFEALNNNDAVIDSSEISTSGGVRDPHVLRGVDGETFYMVVTDLHVPTMGWKNFAMVLMKSSDLVHWTSTKINIPETFPDRFGNVYRVWAPQTIYDPAEEKYMVYFSMKEGNDPDKIYYAYANEDFTGFESAPEQLYFSPTNSACIDADIVFKDGKYSMFYKSESGGGIRLAVSDRLTNGYQLHTSDRVDCSRDAVEGSGIFKLNDSDQYILMYDVYTKGKYQFTTSSDLRSFEVIDSEVSMDFHPRHGTVMPITGEERERLLRQWGDLSPVCESEHVNRLNVVVDHETGAIELPVKPDVDVTSLDPQFTVAHDADVLPKGPQDFSNGAVEYTVWFGKERAGTFDVSVVVNHNPVIPGYFADPDILYSHQLGRFFLYPTSDGFDGWSGTYFNTFSSTNLVDWVDERCVLDLKKDVEWADRHAWAPCIIEKKKDGGYLYYYYFTAAQKIGVAVASHPSGPFVDSGRPLIDFKPSGINRGQEIDPDVFHDPLSGKDYLYWGNGYLAVAELNEDMISIDRSTIETITPDGTFREGVHVFVRNGTYYFLWSENDTRDADYRVRYATAKSPTGPLEIADDNLVIAKSPDVGIFATGHCSTIQVPGTDQWYIVYHRFTYPKGIEMGAAAGYHREVCIDPIQFDDRGRIVRVVPTHRGVSSVVPLAK
ncbi:endo-1,4-beta-xylanase [Rhodopirellula sp. SWK7]|nr:endo-1,4-beta-xylanase [Rhodopirellula sp. SWK7]